MKIYFDEKINDYICDAGTPVWRVVDVRPNEDYILHLTFASGEKRIYDFKPLLEKAIYAPLKNISFFMTAKADGCSVVWNDDIDIAPEYLYERSKPIVIGK